MLLGGGGEHLGVTFYRPEEGGLAGEHSNSPSMAALQRASPACDDGGAEAMELRVDDEVLPLLQVRCAAESQRQEQQQGGATPQGRLAS